MKKSIILIFASLLLLSTFASALLLKSHGNSITGASIVKTYGAKSYVKTPAKIMGKTVGLITGRQYYVGVANVAQQYYVGVANVAQQYNYTNFTTPINYTNVTTPTNLKGILKLEKVPAVGNPFYFPITGGNINTDESLQFKTYIFKTGTTPQNKPQLKVEVFDGNYNLVKTFKHIGLPTSNFVIDGITNYDQILNSLNVKDVGMYSWGDSIIYLTYAQLQTYPWWDYSKQIWVSLIPGEYSVKLTVDQGNNVTESDETDNTFVVKVNVMPSADDCTPGKRQWMNGPYPLSCVPTCTQQTFYRDADNDGYGTPAIVQSACTAPTGFVSNSDDCDDSNAAIKPGATTTCGTGACARTVQNCVNNQVQACILSSPETDDVFCARLGKTCGSVTGVDNCGTSRTVTNCGTCASGQVCGSNGVCIASCTTESNNSFCQRRGWNCGRVTSSDNCGVVRNAVDCGVVIRGTSNCPTGQMCTVGVCRTALKANGQSCTQPSECAERNCISNKCTNYQGCMNACTYNVPNCRTVCSGWWRRTCRRQCSPYRNIDSACVQRNCRY